MIRSTAVALTLLLTPLYADAQQVAGVEQTHTVRSGETLGAIAQQYFGSAGNWTLILEANRDRLPDPDRIQVGLQLVIPSSAQPADSPARVTNVQIVQPSATASSTEQDLASYERRRGLLEAQPFEPVFTDEMSASERTVFFDLPEPESLGSAVVLAELRADMPAVSSFIYQSAGWLIPPGETETPLGEVVAFPADRAPKHPHLTVQALDRVLIRLDAEGEPQVGDEFLLYDILTEIEEIGSIALPTGRVRVVQVGEGEAEVQVTSTFGQVRIGDMVARIRPFSLEPGVHPEEVESDIAARILVLQRRQEVYLPGDIAYIDQGSEAGLQIGDEMIALADPGSDRPQGALARFSVVGLQDASATVRIVGVRAPAAIRPGVRLVVDRKMP